MFSPKQNGRSGSSPSPSRLLRTQKSFKHRFGFDNAEEKSSARACDRAPKRRSFMTFAPFDQYRSGRDDSGGSYGEVNHGRHRRRRSRSPESPVVRELQEKYSNLRLTIHSSAITQLEASQEEMTTEVTSEIKANQVAIARLSEAHSRLTSPIMEVQANKVTNTPGVGKRTEVVNMFIEFQDFEARIKAVSTELEQLWAS
ncbi:hypothetical protein BJ170DRAFT_187369 [Xylariales sp. AK1849]|nr:hypothetical protein BJ170DRAFT_187369 [Xylariales sp. AK1849]